MLIHLYTYTQTQNQKNLLLTRLMSIISSVNLPHFKQQYTSNTFLLNYLYITLRGHIMMNPPWMQNGENEYIMDPVSDIHNF